MFIHIQMIWSWCLVL